MVISVTVTVNLNHTAGIGDEIIGMGRGNSLSCHCLSVYAIVDLSTTVELTEITDMTTLTRVCT